MSRKKSAASGGEATAAGGAVHHTIEYKLLSELNPAPYNPRRMSAAARQGLTACLDEFGSVVPIIWNQQTGNIVGGHQQYDYLVEKGAAGTDVRVVDLPPAKERALNLALNNPAIAGEFTDDVANLVAELQLELPELFFDLRLDHIAFDVPQMDVAAEWEGMPEYESGDVGPHRQLLVSFRNEEDVQAFAALLGQKVSPKTKSLWFPPAEKDSTKDLCYKDGDES